MEGKSDNDSSKDPLLLTTIDRDIENGSRPNNNNNNVQGSTPSSSLSQRDVGFKAYVILSALTIWTTHALITRASLVNQSSKDLYHGSTVVVLSETVKLLCSLCLLLRSNGWRWRETQSELIRDIWCEQADTLKMAVPSVLYAIMNNLEFVALRYIQPPVYVVTNQLKIVTTAFMMMFLLGRSFSGRRWTAILMLTAGVATVQLSQINDNNSTKTGTEEGNNYFLGVGVVIICCFLSAFSGVWFERMLKKDSGSQKRETSVWIRNIQLYAWGILVTAVVCLTNDGRAIWTDGFFHGYNPKVFVILGLLSVGGIYTSLLMKYLDNLMKTFTNAFSIILVLIGSMYLFNMSIDLMCVVGILTVCSALVLYNSVAE